MLLFQLLLLFTTLFYPCLSTAHTLPHPAGRTGDAACSQAGTELVRCSDLTHHNKHQPSTVRPPQREEANAGAGEEHNQPPRLQRPGHKGRSPSQQQTPFASHRPALTRAAEGRA